MISGSSSSMPATWPRRLGFGLLQVQRPSQDGQHSSVLVAIGRLLRADDHGEVEDTNRHGSKLIGRSLAGQILVGHAIANAVKNAQEAKVGHQTVEVKCFEFP